MDKPWFCLACYFDGELIWDWLHSSRIFFLQDVYEAKGVHQRLFGTRDVPVTIPRSWVAGYEDTWVHSDVGFWDEDYMQVGFLQVRKVYNE